jgi:hypothetical protein
MIEQLQSPLFDPCSFYSKDGLPLLTLRLEAKNKTSFGLLGFVLW